MSVFLPAAGIGNSLSLATVGAAGEVMGFFYPHLDYAQNVREGMPAVYVPGGDGPPLLWCFADCFERSQSLKKGTNILVTSLRHRTRELRIEITDLLPPGEHALVRRVRLTCGPEVGPATFMQYFNLALGDGAARNAVHYVPASQSIVQYFRDICLAVAADRPFSFQTGVIGPDGASPTKGGMASGRLNGSRLAMGKVEFAVALEADGTPQQEATQSAPGTNHNSPEGDGKRQWEATLVMAGAGRLHQAAADARRLADTPFEEHERRASARCRSILDQAAPCRLPDLTGAYHTSVLVLHDLYDEENKTFIAAPEFDPGYRYSGGYGYCWPRDAAVSGMVAARIGFADLAEGFFEWARRCQLDDGHWFQRYWTDGTEAPSWCVLQGELQLDQTCAMLHAATELADLLEGGRRAAFVERFREPARRAAEAIIRHIGNDGLHLPAADLWECSHGTFPYTQAAVIASLGEGRRVFGTPAVDLDRLRRALFERLWNVGHGAWPRRIDPQGNLDLTLDSSCLGVIYPWAVLDLSDPQDRDVAEQTVKTVATRLALDVPGGKAILRFENESYMGGGAGCVNTLWLALCRLRLAAVSRGQKRKRHKDEARALIATALANTNPAGQLPELIPSRDFGYWAAPHGWASSLLIECVSALQDLEEAPASRSAEQIEPRSRPLPSHS